ncbi:MAG: hypothetical protein AAF393_01055 [Pseudomonadota bacterium]
MSFVQATLFGAFGGWIAGLLISVFWHVKYALLLSVGLIGLAAISYGLGALQDPDGTSLLGLGGTFAFGASAIGILAGIVTYWFARIFGTDL